MAYTVPQQEAIADWTSVQSLHADLTRDKNRRWLFRGQRCHSWELKSGLERTVVERFGRAWSEVPTWEAHLSREFKRHAHRYISDLPEDEDTLRWWALMQHHGAPTRLLDFTYSFHVALYFALEEATSNDTCAVWAIDHDWCWDQAQAKLPRELVELIRSDRTGGKAPATVTALLQCCMPLAIPMNPLPLDERLAVQQGVFLCPLAAEKPFAENLGAAPESVLMRIPVQCSDQFLKDALWRLHEMNVNRISLFPGLDGLAQNLHNVVAMPQRFPLDRTWRDL